MTHTRKPLRRTIRGGRPFFFADPAIDKILNMVVTLGSEVWALRERLAAVDAIQERQGSLAAGEVDGVLVYHCLDISAPVVEQLWKEERLLARALVAGRSRA